MNRHTCPIFRASPDDGWHYWFGYYDKCPWSPDGTRLLAHRARFCDRFPAPGDEAEVGWIEGWSDDAPVFHRAGRTPRWNWQQGAMLRWSGDAIRFNSAAGPLVYTEHPGTGDALTLDFGRLSRLRPEYGYPGLTDPHPGEAAPEADGIYRIEKGDRRLIVSLAQLDRITADGTPAAGGSLDQHVNHLMFNPSGSRFCFMHRFVRTDGILHSRLFTSDPEGRDVRLLFEGLVSHYDWQDDRTILAWAGRRSLLGSANARKTPVQRAATLARRGLKPVYYAMGKPRFLMNRIMKDSYLLIPDADMRTGGAPQPEPFAKGELTCDGHCTFNRGGAEPGRWVLTDGYPDLKSRQPLFLWDRRENRGFEIGRYDTPRELDGDIRVDLHPRFSRDASLACIDSAMEGKRAMYVVDVSHLTRGE